MNTTLVSLLRESVRSSPDAEALVVGRERVSYGELWRRIETIAEFLRQRGLQPGDRVGLVLDNSTEYVAAYYATLASSGVVVALNTAARERDLASWIEHSGVNFLIVDTSHPSWPVLSEALGDIQILKFGAAGPPSGHPGHFEWSDVLAATMGKPVRTVEPASVDAPAAIIYTSGTTGRPKGVTLSHRNLFANARSILAYLPIDAKTRTVNVLPFYYSYGNSVLHTHLAAGACLVLENSLTYPHRVVERMVEERATGFNGVPSTYSLLLNRVRMQDYDLSALRFLTQAGGAMSPVLATRLLESLPRVDLYIMYGQTEATARLSYLPPRRIRDKPGSAGIAIPGVTLEIRGDDGAEQSRGVVGEIWARGDNVMVGYWNDPDATRAVSHDGWLKTGDMARMDEDGFLYIDGRRSDMIKTGAHRVNPADIEEVLLEIDGIAEAVAVGVEDDVLGQVIKVVVVPGAGCQLDTIAVKAHCRRRLATYKIPKYVEFASELPKTASGKIKRFELAVRPTQQLG